MIHDMIFKETIWDINQNMKYVCVGRNERDISFTF